MKKLSLILLAIGSCVGVYGLDLIEDGFYPMDKIPEKAEIKTLFRDDFEFKLEENVTTGYTWQARYNPDEVRVEIEHERGKNRKLTGSPGYADIEIKLLRNKEATIEFYYSRPFEKDQKAVKTIVCTVIPIEKKVVAPKENGAVDVSVLPVLFDDAYLKLDKIPSAMQVILPIGREVSFDIEEDDKNLRFWNISGYPNKGVEVEIDHEESGLFFQKSHAEIEVEAKKSGSYKLELVYAKDTPLQKIFTLYITVQ